MINVLRRCLRKLRGTEEILGEGLVILGLGGLGCDIALLLLILWSKFSLECLALKQLSLAIILQLKGRSG